MTKLSLGGLGCGVPENEVLMLTEFLAGRLQGSKTLLCIIKLSFTIISLTFLCIQGIAGDIQAHERAYKEELCSKCWELVVRGSHDAEELQQKLDKFKQRWNTLQVRQQ